MDEMLSQLRLPVAPGQETATDMDLVPRNFICGVHVFWQVFNY